MTAISAQSASQTSSNSARTVLLPGSPATYANRAFLKGLGLRWDPEGHRWHGTASPESVRALREQLGLEVRCFGSLDIAATEIAPKGPVAPKPAGSRHSHDFSRTSFESRIAFAVPDDEPDEVAVQGRRFSLLEITSGLPDDSREADERATARHLRDLRGCVKAARATVAATPGLAEVLQSDWKRAAGFYARFGVTEGQLRCGVPFDASNSASESENW
jgi:hypothetical protein